ncbi:hypothetical protein CUMW_227230 [Citrus unshiu]|uniref:Serine-threonine/tyrosine-protein kinase catalytic domain-containing protein n=1 Tax=Citrus unshiu TaxID=55188 RepID=A0A2H5QHD7_CITUN|nr:hypothetical protein CUMW_227230 [Citrus unshiu]
MRFWLCLQGKNSGWDEGCSEALVLEYMPHGSLEKCLYSSNYILDIFQRLNIMIDVALVSYSRDYAATSP